MEPGPAHKRRRPAVACTECRRRKIRCDRHFPCGPCSKANPALRCVYHNDGVHPRTSSLSNPGECRLEDPIMPHGVFTSPLGSGLSVCPDILDSSCHNPDVFSLALTQLPDDSTDPFFVDSDSLGLTTALSNANSLGSSQMHIGSQSPTWMDTSSSSTRASSLFGSDEYPSISKRVSGSVRSGLEHSRQLSTDPPTSDQQWYGVFAQFRPLRFLHDAISGHRLGEKNCPSLEADTVQPLLESFIRLDDITRRECNDRTQSFGWAAGALLTSCSAQDLLPPRAACDTLLEAYLSTFQSVLPILDVPLFARDYETLWGSSTARWVDADEPFLCKLLLAMAVGSCMCLRLHIANEPDRSRGMSLQEQADRWITYGKQWLARHMVAGSRPDLDMAQILCLLTLTRHTHQSATASPRIGPFIGDFDLTRIAFQMGLHRDPRLCTPNITDHEADMRRRLWLIMLELSLQQCFDNELPAPITPESYDSKLPSSIAADDDASYASNSNSTTKVTSTPVILLQLGQTQRLRLRVLQLINAPGSSKTYDDCHQLAAELHAVCSANSELVGRTATAFQMKIFEDFTRPFILALHGPFAEQATRNPCYYFSRRMRMETAAQLLKRQAQSPLSHSPEPQCSISTSQAMQTAHEGNTSGSSISAKSNYRGSPSTSYPAAQTEWDACATLRIHGGGHFALTQRQATTVLITDLINELRENSFPALDSVSQNQLRDTLRKSVNDFECRVRAFDGVHSTHEFLFFAAATAYINAIQRKFGPYDIDKAVVRATRLALKVCCDAMERQRRTNNE